MKSLLGAALVVGGAVALTMGAACADEGPIAPAACANGASPNGETGGAGGGDGLVGQSVQPSEWVGFHTEIPMTPDQLHHLASGLFGPDAQGGALLGETEIAPKIFLSAAADPSTPDQTQITIAFDDGDRDQRRKLAVAPASFAIGNAFVTTIDAALAKMQADNADKSGQGEMFLLEHRIFSSYGGKLSFGVKGDGGVYSLVLDVTSPRTSLVPATLGAAADPTGPYDTIAGTVYFHMSYDDFDFFTNHAYGAGAESKQNFKDFALIPHDWLRLTVEPHLDQKFVDVGFEVLALDGSRLPVAKAPASVPAGDTFQKLVLRNMSTMTDQEGTKKGSSTPWSSPFYYDDPAGGGVVQVIAQGNLGVFTVAYSIESPQHPLHDVELVQYDKVKIAAPDPSETASCEQLGDPNITLAPQGTLNITFSASSTVSTSPDLKVPLVGDIYCALYHASDVNVGGPILNAMEISDFTLPMADLTKSPTYTTQVLIAGDYQVLCAQDLDHSGGASKGDPVTLPIGAYTVACNENPVTVEFALLDPED